MAIKKFSKVAVELRAQPTSTACTMVRQNRVTTSEAGVIEGRGEHLRKLCSDNAAMRTALQKHSSIHLYPSPPTASQLL